MIILQKENLDQIAFDSVFQKITEDGAKEMKIHFVYASRYYYWYDAKLRTSILKGMKKYNVKSIMVTIINMLRAQLITKKEMEKYCKGHMYSHRKYSVNDDVESVFEDLRLGKQRGGGASIYFLPKLTDEELEMTKRKDTAYFQTFHESNPVVGSESGSKDMEFVKGYGARITFTIEN